MDFGALLHVAKQNSSAGKDSGGKYYSTKYSAPKKETKEKKLSDNIKKFLIKKEQEEKEQARLEKEKRDKLMSMRDTKSKNKIKKMLKVIKSANKSVLEEAVDTENTAVTLQGPQQPDEDDYGYVSNEAAAFFQKYVEKVKHVHEDKTFAPSRPQSRHDLCGTKDRVKAAIVKEQDEKAFPQRTRTSASTSSSTRVSHSESSRHKDVYDPQAEKDRELEEKRRKEKERNKFKKPMPPPMDFKQLMKLAEKKQFEPIEIEVKVEKKEGTEKLLTKKEKREQEEKQRWLEEREKRKRMNEKPTSNKNPPVKIPKLNPSDVPKSTLNSSSTSKSVSKPSSTSSSSATSKENGKKPQATSQPVTARPFSLPRGPANAPSGPSYIKPSSNSKAPPSKTAAPSSKTKPAPYNGPTREFPPRDVSSKSGPNEQKTREFPPRDMIGRKPTLSSNRQKGMDKKAAAKRRIYDDSEDEYDSELDDFIDDGDAEEDYSSHIKEIFGYDKSKYRNERYEDDDRMEASFAQQMREEYVSKKIGIMEDLEDMRLEAMEKKKKAIMKKNSR